MPQHPHSDCRGTGALHNSVRQPGVVDELHAGLTNISKLSRTDECDGGSANRPTVNSTDTGVRSGAGTVFNDVEPGMPNIGGSAHRRCPRTVLPAVRSQGAGKIKQRALRCSMLARATGVCWPGSLTRHARLASPRAADGVRDTAIAARNGMFGSGQSAPIASTTARPALAPPHLMAAQQRGSLRAGELLAAVRS
ncbi:hypothetical protein P154DRAFT_581564 [Amniculicola lignicola CBS 123094]|uniref:Uncharacterized protein n=1 Tax=Amniculicola lignicola CBS 123094 TaxID=1392246 RepID=A0A6A5VZ58_9PLEO|nr:hypothetical protein P154DRAFT_581564 [Amniculicola lignicola CBS 123094]